MAVLEVQARESEYAQFGLGDGYWWMTIVLVAGQWSAGWGLDSEDVTWAAMDPETGVDEPF